MTRDQEFHGIIHEIIKNKVFQKTKRIRHHNDSVFHHSLQVAYLSYRIAKKFKLDYHSAARAGLLHDFFLYDWRAPKKNRFFEKHGFTHAREAHRNAKKHFKLNLKEEDAILKHMFPLTISPPNNSISWIVTLADKYISTVEYAQRLKAKTLKKNHKK